MESTVHGVVIYAVAIVLLVVIDLVLSLARRRPRALERKPRHPSLVALQGRRGIALMARDDAVSGRRAA